MGLNFTLSKGRAGDFPKSLQLNLKRQFLAIIIKNPLERTTDSVTVTYCRLHNTLRLKGKLSSPWINPFDWLFDGINEDNLCNAINKYKPLRLNNGRCRSVKTSFSAEVIKWKTARLLFQSSHSRVKIREGCFIAITPIIFV